MEERRQKSSDIETSSYLPPSMLEKRVNWDVFLSFRGEDTRHSFTKPLRDALEFKGLRPFMDDRGMERGDTIQPTLEEAIIDSALAVAIISPKYADSRWCLHELSRIFDCRKRVIPVFYGVDPSDVRRQRGVFGKGFQYLLEDQNKKFSHDEIISWRTALEAVGNISGYPCRSQSDEVEEVIRHIVEQVWNELKNTPEYVVKIAVGLDSRIDEVIAKLNIHSKGVQFLGIHGTPGIGKTTLAKAVFNKLVVNFKNRCFISNVREQLSDEEGLLSVQKKLIRDLYPERVVSSVTNNDAAKQAIKITLNENRVLIVLDDVSEAEQLKNLGIIRGWFEEDGSRIIVTSRNVNAFDDFSNGDHELFEAKKLDQEESLELFSIHALGRRFPTQDFRVISEEIVSLTGGLPLALEVFGSFLVKKKLSEWEDALMKLKKFRPPSLQDVLKISYDGLDEQEKTVFLDISCLFIQMNMKKVDVIHILEGCGLSAELEMGRLVTKSLLKIRKDEYNELWMHDQIRDMGRQVVREESSDDIGKRSRLWDSEDIFEVLRHENVTEAVRGIVLDIKKPPNTPDKLSYWNNFKRKPNISTFILYVEEKFKGILSRRKPDEDYCNSTLQTKWFKKMENLKLFQMNYAKLKGDFKYIFPELRWLQWKGCSQKTFTANIPEHLRVLDLSESKIERLWCSDHSCWAFNKVARNLVVINLYGCHYLTDLPDLSGHKHLKKLTLELCVGLTKIHESLGNMSSLVHLNLRRCSNLIEFPTDVTGMKGLKELLLSECIKFRGLPDDIRSMTSLKQLLLDSTAITKLPRYLFHLTQLQELSLHSCYRITRLPDDIGFLASLKLLSLSDTKLKELPNALGSLTRLETLKLMFCSSLTTLPDSVGKLNSLIKLYLNSSSIQHLPTSICSLSYLKVLSLGRCNSLVKLPVSVEGLASIVELELTKTPIKELPDDICSLKFIEKLQMKDCCFLERLPESIGKMSNLTILSVEGTDLTELPESIGELENLTRLNIKNCQKLCRLPDSIGTLRSLQVFMMEETAITSLPESFGLLHCLRILKMRKSSNKLARLTALPDSFCNLTNLEEFDAWTCGICGQINDDFKKLSKLETLNLGYNNFHNLPATLEGLCVLQELLLCHCIELKALPRLPSTLVELNAADCYELVSICDLSNLERLQELRLANCNNIVDVPGLECLKSLRRLFLGGCSNAIKSAFQRRLSKASLRNLNNLSIPGSEIPNWFSQTAVTFAAHPNLAIKNVIIAVVVLVDPQEIDEIRAHQYPGITDIQARIVRCGTPIFSTTLYLMGVPRTQEEQLYLCRFKSYNPLVSLLQEGDIIKLGWRINTVNGIEIKRWGIYLVFENDDDFDGDEDSLSVVESQQSVSHRLVKFFRSMDQG